VGTLISDNGRRIFFSFTYIHLELLINPSLSKCKVQKLSINKFSPKINDKNNGNQKILGKEKSS